MRWASACAVVAAFPCTVASAGPPYLTDDPEPVDRGHVEAYLFTEVEAVAGGRSGTLPGVEVNYGPFANAQIMVAMSSRSVGFRNAASATG